VRSPQIFFDPSGRRKHVVNVVGLAAISVILALMGAVFAGLLFVPKIMSPVSPGQSQPAFADGGRPQANPIAVPRFKAWRRGSWPTSAVDAQRYAFFKSWIPGSLSSLQDHVNMLDGLLPFFLEISAKDGGLIQTDQEAERVVRDLMRESGEDLDVFPVLTSSEKPAELASNLSTPPLRARFIEAISGYLSRNDDAGIALDFNNLPSSSRFNLMAFLDELGRTLHADGRKLILITRTMEDGTRFGELAQVVDFFLINIHQVGDLDSAPAAQEWFESNLAELARIIPATKLIIGLGSYANVFSGSFGEPKTISVQSAWTLMNQAGATLSLDENTLNAHYRYVDSGGLISHVWILDGVTVFNQMRAALPYQPGGFAISELGREDPSAWASFAKGRAPDAKARTELMTPQAGYDLDRHSSLTEVEVVAVKAVAGTRSLDYDDQFGLIVGEQLQKAPRRYSYASSDFVNSNTIALTFDGGPDPKVTGRILDILRDKGIKATFFVIGKSALENADILRRTYSEGHDIGNLTYTYPKWWNISDQALRREMTACQRTLEAILGIYTTLFRLPYAATSIADQPGSLRAVETASELGYATIMSAIETYDYLNPPSQAIHEAVVRQVVEGKGHVILLHDAGKRQMTIDALPLIIDSLQTKGYRFVTVHELLGTDRAEVMPQAHTDDVLDALAAILRHYGIFGMGTAGTLLSVLTIAGIIVIVARFFFVVAFMPRHRRIEKTRRDFVWWPSSVAVILPAFNEEKVICNTVESLLAADSPPFEIIVADDGSSDRTADIVRETYPNNPRIRVFKKPNGGKAAAANFAMEHTDAEVVVAIDADTVLAPDAIPLLVRHFSDPAVGAVAGFAVVGNKVNLLTTFQFTEYTIGQSLDRRAFACLNANGVVPGAIGAWRRKALLSAGGYSSETLAEDADATLAVIRAGWKVAFEPLSKAYTEAPETLRDFMKQRYRWTFGMLQLVVKYRASAFCGHPRSLGWLIMPNMTLFLLQYAFISPILDGVAAYHLWTMLAHFPDLFATGSSPEMPWQVMVWLPLQLFDLLALVLLMRVANISDWHKLLPVILLQRLMYQPLLYLTAMRTVLDAAKGQVRGWNKLLRTGSVSAKAVTVSRRPS
jgi:cellulose synthase/poly-beta-1,6-N-acetylglucosamine synthase-like glycosyltransferase/peptidoglycan/xylan/chitin deacetylase (PgdA/CDA1 family)/spore germination protein YaaH